jgi:hypothetical protein
MSVAEAVPLEVLLLSWATTKLARAKRAGAKKSMVMGWGLEAKGQKVLKDATKDCVVSGLSNQAAKGSRRVGGKEVNTG